MKPFQTSDLQISILKTRGLKISNSKAIRNILETENYYNVINGYKELFLASVKTATCDEKYKTNTKFSEIYSLYEFDIELRNILLKRILKIENNIKTLIAYEFSRKYGHDTYLLEANFASSQRSNVINLITKINDDIQIQRSKNLALQHYLINYGYVPLWVLVNILTFGTISKFYSWMKQTEKQSVSKRYKISDSQMDNILGLLTLYRNKCAHSERLYNFVSPKLVLNDNQIHTKLKIPRNNNGAIYGKKDLFSLIIIFKILLNKTELSLLVTDIKNCLRKLSNSLKTVPIDDVLSKMGFPQNWKDITKV